MPFTFKTLLTLAYLSAAACVRPAPSLVDDRYPTGYATPEGVACDAVRAYIRGDPDLWLSTLLPASYYGDVRNANGAQEVAKYEDFKTDMVEKTKANAADPSIGKMRIAAVYRARPFSAMGPASLAYGLYECRGNMFVDIRIVDGTAEVTQVRYHVMQDKQGRWYFDPRPDLIPLLSLGMNHETESTEEWKR